MSDREHATKAAQALADLNAFGNIISLMESGNWYPPSHRATDRIIKICQEEISKRCREYDAALARIKA